jgi:hypothetical protein
MPDEYPALPAAPERDAIDDLVDWQMNPERQPDPTYRACLSCGTEWTAPINRCPGCGRIRTI